MTQWNPVKKEKRELCFALEQFLSASAPLTSEPCFLPLGACHVHCRIFSGIPDLCPPNTSGTPPHLWQPKMSPYVARCPPGAKTIRLQTTALEEWFSKFSVFQNHMKGLLKQWLLEWNPPVSSWFSKSSMGPKNLHHSSDAAASPRVRFWEPLP